MANMPTTAGIPATQPKMAGQEPVPEAEANAAEASGNNTSSEDKDKDSEIELVSSLAKLQQLETTIHHLRTLLPGRMLAPLAPIVQPRRGGIEKSSSLPQSPQVLYQQLSQSAQAGVDEIKRFQGLWRSPEMRGIWERVENGIREKGGLLQTSGVWEVDYAEMLEGLVREEVGKGEREGREEEEREKERLRDSGCEWRGIVEEFIQKDVSGVRVVPGRNEASVMVALVKAGMVFQLHTVVAGLEGSGDVPDWKVESKHSPGKPVTRLENAIVDCLNGRGRQWDLGYLLDMISSYAEIKQTPCKKCARMTDSSAQLPSLRKSVAVTSPEGTRSFTFEPYHPGCI